MNTENKKAVVKLNKTRTEILLGEFAEFKETFLYGKENIQSVMTEKLAENRIIELSEMAEIEKFILPVKEQIKQYTQGFPSFLRSVGKADDEHKKDLEPMLNDVRKVIQEAREIEDDLDWIVNHYTNKIKIQNIKLGYFESDQPPTNGDQTEPKEDDPAAQPETAVAQPAEPQPKVDP